MTVPRAPRPSAPRAVPNAASSREAPPQRGVAIVAAAVALGALGIVAAAAWMVVAGSRPAAAADAPRPAPASAAATAAAPAVSPAARSGVVTRTPRVEVVSPRMERWTDTVSATGNIAAWQEASVGADTAGLRLQTVRVQPGQRVTRGQILASFDDTAVRTELAQIRANVAEAEAAAGEARTNAGRAKDVTGSGVLSGQQLTQFATAAETATARLEALRAAEQLQQLRLERTLVRAPADGIVASRSATVGAVPGPGQELFRLIVDNRLEWRAEINAADLPGIAVGMPVRVVPVGAAATKGQVRQIAPVVDAATRRAVVHVDLPAGDALRPGLFASGSIERAATSILTLPQAALVSTDAAARVLVVDEARTVRAVRVTTGRRRGDRVEILDGLDANARVVAQGGAFLAEGDRVEVIASPGPLAADGRGQAAATP